MARNKRFAATLEQELIPFLASLEAYFAAAGLGATDYSSYTEIRKALETYAKIIRNGGHLWAATADAALMKINDLQDALPVILKKMPPGFTLQWNALAKHLENDAQAMLEE